MYNLSPTLNLKVMESSFSIIFFVKKKLENDINTSLLLPSLERCLMKGQFVAGQGDQYFQ